MRRHRCAYSYLRNCRSCGADRSDLWFSTDLHRLPSAHRPLRRRKALSGEPDCEVINTWPEVDAARRAT